MGELVATAGQMLDDGADILDVGGYSSRPGADDISVEEETRRVTIAIEAIKKAYPKAIISVDTFRANVAKSAVEEGADIINDISGGTLDERMLPTVAALNMPYILMHMRGTPQTMTSLTYYRELITDVKDFFTEQASKLRELGYQNEIILDPGFGFAKTIEQNFELLAKLEELRELNCPLLVGVSRKSMIWKTLGSTPKEALNGTTVLNSVALLKGANILRVHDVKEAVEARTLIAKTLDKRL